MEKHIRIYLKLLFFGLLLSLLAGCTQEGDDDFSLPRDKYAGEWICQDADGAGYKATITSDPSNSAQVIIYNFFGLGLKGTVTAIVTSQSITVTEQTMQGVPGTYRCYGIGLLNNKNNIITWDPYIANDDKTTSIYTKQ